MKKSTLLSFLFILINLHTYSQNIVGTWKGELDLNTYKLPIVFNISKINNQQYATTLDSPSQNAFGIEADSTSFIDTSLYININISNINFLGTLQANHKLKGYFNQNGMKIPLTLEKGNITKKEQLKRPQTPKEPYPYMSENVTFKNTKANITLAGTLTLPSTKGKFTTVILISGSGPQNRDSEVFNHKPFFGKG